jgi:2-succinyl-5-enolpyruvyl-6-hydroxy-3-cyclohexene-1-carboxylate synthase
LDLGSEGSKLESMQQSPPKTHSERSKSASVPPQSPQKMHSQKQKEHKKHWTQKKCQATQEAARMSMKAVVKKRVLESCRIAVLSDYSAEKDVLVSSSSWIGLLSWGHKPAQDQDNPIQDQAKKRGLTYFPWDGQ